MNPAADSGPDGSSSPRRRPADRENQQQARGRSLHSNAPAVHHRHDEVRRERPRTESASRGQFTMTQQLPADHASRMERARLALEGLSVAMPRRNLFSCPTTSKRSWRIPGNCEGPVAVDGRHRHGARHLRSAGRFAATLDQERPAKRSPRALRRGAMAGYGGGAFRMLGQWPRRRLAARRPEHVRRPGLVREWLGDADRAARGLLRRIGVRGGSAEHAALSAAVTHAHPEGIAGGIAVAVAGTYAWITATGAPIQL